jgi:hypothetical protein
VLLTNRVHPTRDNKQVQAFRRQLHDEIVGSLLSGRRLTASDHRPTS